LNVPRSSKPVPPVIQDRIRDEDSAIVERIVVFLIAMWLGALVMVTLSATGSFKAVQVSMDKPSAAVVKSMARIGVDETRSLLHEHSGEVNRQMFEIWGWIQLGVTGAVLLGLLFMTNTGKAALGVAGGMTAFSALMAGFLIPSMIRVGRQLRASPGSASADLTSSFRNLHQAFGAFEVATATLSLFLIAALVRRRSRARR